MKRIAIAAAFAVMATTPAAAENCGDRESVLQLLEGKYGENSIGLALMSSAGIFEVFISPDAGGTWTIVRTVENGQTCYVADGPIWISIATPEGEPS